MIYPKNNKLLFWIFKSYVKWRVDRHFREVLFNEIDIDKNKSLLLIANHYSFWDTLVLFCINEGLFKKKPYVMALEETMRKEPMLKYAGAFSVKKNSREVVQSIDYAAELLNDPGNTVLLYPQGKLYPNFTEHIHFEPGTARVMEKAGDTFQVVFAAAFVQYFRHPKPTVTVYLKKEFVNPAGLSPENLQKAYQQHFDISKMQQITIDTDQ